MHFIFDAIGTHWVIDIFDELTPEKSEDLKRKILERIDIFDKDYSRFRADSLVTEISKKTGEYRLPADAKLMMSVYRTMYDATEGLVTPLIGNLISDAGYDAQYSLVQKKELVRPPAWESAFTYDHPILSVREPVLLDFGAAGKGYLIDIVGELLEAENVQNYCIDAGGDIRQRDARGMPLSVALEHPLDSAKAIGVASVYNKSLCGSAGNRRVWQDFHHIINPKTLRSPKDILAVWAIADTTLIADIVTTGLFFVRPEKLRPHFSFDYAILYSDLSFEKSPGFPVEIFTVPGLH